MSTGLKANNDGSAAIQVGGTDYITISSTGAVAIPVSLSVGGIPSGGNYILTSYVAPATWDATTKKAAGLKAIKVTVVGAGGNGGVSGTSNPTSTGDGGGGGGGGGSAITYLPAASITPGSKTVTAGTGTNSFGPWGTATPFSPTATTTATAGSAGGAGSIPAGGAGGAGGVGSGGSLALSGTSGLTGTNIGGASGTSAIFSASILVADIVPGSLPGTPNSIYGGGGSGGGQRSPPGGSNPGSTGAPGVVIIEEFY